jgi:hypothetical protein
VEYFGYERRQYADVRQLEPSSVAPLRRTSIVADSASDSAISPAE